MNRRMCLRRDSRNFSTKLWWMRLVPVKEVFEQQGIHFEPGQLERFEGYMQLLPHVNNTDGFFAAVLQRDE